jgi:hypothetical protein
LLRNGVGASKMLYSRNASIRWIIQNIATEPIA